MAQENWVTNHDAGAAVVKFRFVKWGASDHTVVQAAAVGDAIMGVSNILGAEASGDPVDVVRGGLAKVEYGGTITRGDPLTSDANGKAVKAAPATGVNNRIGGYAEVSGVSGDIGLVDVRPGEFQGA